MKKQNIGWVKIPMFNKGLLSLFQLIVEVFLKLLYLGHYYVGAIGVFILVLVIVVLVVVFCLVKGCKGRYFSYNGPIKCPTLIQTVLNIFGHLFLFVAAVEYN